MKNNSPPTLANWFIRSFVRDELHEEFFGDLEEIYQERASTHGTRYAQWFYWLDALHLLLGFSSLPQFTHNPTIMYRHYLTTAHRNLVRNKFYSLINILGLAVGIGVCLLICQYVYVELRYDKFHNQYRNTYRILLNETKEGINQGVSPYTDYAFGTSAAEEIPGIEQYVRLYVEEYDLVVTNPENDRAINEEAADLFYTDESFLETFNFPLKLGNPASALDERYNIVITEAMAEKYFQADNPLGKTLTISGGSSPGDYIVAGVLEKLPINSHLQFQFLLPLANYWELGNGGSVNRYGGWGRPIFATYFTLDESANRSAVREKLNQLIAKYQAAGSDPDNVVKKVQFQPIADIHLSDEVYTAADYVANRGSKQDVWIFSAIALFILLIAWVNYINLSTARAMRRSKEVGIRKSIGAFRKQLVSQFLLESVLINMLAGVLAMGIAVLTLPILSQVIGKELAMSLLQLPLFWAWFMGVIIIGALLSGLYPAFILSGFKPVSMLGAGRTSRSGSINLRRGLITFQFLLSLVFIAATYLVYQQIAFMKNQELGMEIEKILIVKGPKKIPDAPEVTDGTDMDQIRAANTFSRSTFDVFRNQITDYHSIVAATGSYAIPGQVYNTAVPDVRKEGEPEGSGNYGRYIFAGLDFVQTYGLELIAGRSFTAEMAEEEYVIINEEATQTYGLGSPEEAVQQKLIFDGYPVTIAGVVKNFHWQSLKDPHTPYLLIFVGSTPPYISLNMKLSNIQESLAYVEETYQSVFAGNPFEYFFLEEDFNRQYQADVQFGNLFLAFTTLAIIIACIGLLALVSYSATLRTKEIGIRKVLGASISDVMMLLSKEYLILLLIATLSAVPIILYWGVNWLDNYAFRTKIGPDLLIVPTLILFLIAIITVSYRTYAAAKANPVKSLRIE